MAHRSESRGVPFPWRLYLKGLYFARFLSLRLLTWDMVLGPTGEIGLVFKLRDRAGKKKSGSLIPIHPSLRTALAAWRNMTTGTGPVIRSERGGSMTPVSIVSWFAIAYRSVGLDCQR